MGKNYQDYSGDKNPNFKHGCSPSFGRKPSWYISWSNMKARCLNVNHPKFKNYGGRGIKLHKEWQTAESFKLWVDISGWKQGLTIDRINVNGNYEPSNCRWLTASENSRRKTTNKLTIDEVIKIKIRLLNGEKMSRLAREYGVSHAMVWGIKNNFKHKHIK
jgi:hypothetical protein